MADFSLDFGSDRIQRVRRRDERLHPQALFPELEAWRPGWRNPLGDIAVFAEQRRSTQQEPQSRHFVRVYAIRKPFRSALRCEPLPTSVTIIAKSQPSLYCC
jgi:hypothetical protein